MSKVHQIRVCHRRGNSIKFSLNTVKVFSIVNSSFKQIYEYIMKKILYHKSILIVWVLGPYYITSALVRYVNCAYSSSCCCDKTLFELLLLPIALIRSNLWIIWKILFQFHLKWGERTLIRRLIIWRKCIPPDMCHTTTDNLRNNQLLYETQTHNDYQQYQEKTSIISAIY